MREIKFRAWDKQENRMFEVHEIMFPQNPAFTGSVSGENLEPIPLLGRCELMQFTGLLDKDGKEIFEGDIVNYHENDECGIAEIEYWPGSFVFRWIKQTTPSPSIINSAFYFGYAGALSILGNIHSDPELLQENSQ